jgi:hypothetical protein
MTKIKPLTHETSNGRNVEKQSLEEKTKFLMQFDAN